MAGGIGPPQDWKRRALVGTSLKDSAKDEAPVTALGFVPPSPYGEPVVSLDRADAFIDGLRLFAALLTTARLTRPPNYCHSFLLKHIVGGLRWDSLVLS